MAKIIKAPRGTQDITGAESYKWQFVENILISTSKLYGFKEMRTPTFEDMSLFKRSVGDTTDVVQKEMYQVQAEKGKDLYGLKPEGTAGAVSPAPASGLWYRDALWYAREHGMVEGQPMEASFDVPAVRQDLAEWLCSALPANTLTPINVVGALPDSSDPEVLALYQAGILTGVDDTGAFAPERTLTRAELAAVLARVADPSLRVLLPSGGAS